MYPRTLLLILAAIPLLFGQKTRFEAQFHQSYPMQPGSRLSVENLNGSIEISGWDQNTIDVSATKYAETEQLLGQLNIEVASGPDGIRSRSTAPAESGNVGVKYIQTVPRRADV